MTVPIAPNWVVWLMTGTVILATLGTFINEKIPAATKLVQFLVAPVTVWVMLQALK